jgi:putative ABC transport system permease protein
VESIIGADERYFNDVISYVDAGFFGVFDLEMVAGDRDRIATSVNDILINETLAQKHFGEQDAVGRVVSATTMRNFFNNMDPNAEYRVAGVFKDIPANSHLPFKALALLDPNRFEGVNEGFGGAWLDAAYFKFFPGVDPGELESRLSGFYSNVAPPRGDESETYDYRVDRKFNFINVADVHLHSDKIQQLKPIGDFNTVISFAIAAVLILVIAAINFMNLTTARALRRAKEVSLRKVMGASRRQLVRQFMGEAVLTSLAGLAVALIAVEAILPWFNQYLGKAMQLDFLGNPVQTGIIVMAAMMVGALGGIYPAFFLSSYRPAHVMGSSTSANKGSPRVRQALVVLQFAISIFLIVATAIVYQQTRLLRDMELGIEKDHKLAITGVSADAVQAMEGTIRQEMLNIPEVTAVALSSDELPLVFYNSITLEIPALGITEGIDTDRFFVDTHFLDLYGIEAIAGRAFAAEFTADGLVRSEDKDVPWTRNAVVTETFVRTAGLSRPEDMLGQLLVAPEYGNDGEHLHATVIGVVPDLHLRALRERTEQMVFFNTDAVFDIMTLKIESSDLAATLAEIDKTWQNIMPQVPIKRYFVNDRYAALYDPEERRSQVFAAFSVFAVFVACLGLFGLAAYSAEQRTLEIGIRKVLGARISDILSLIGAQFMKSVLWANVIAWPMVYLVMRDWLDGYEFRIDIDPLVFIACGLLTVVVAWLTIGWQVLKIARAKPIRALRYE